MAKSESNKFFKDKDDDFVPSFARRNKDQHTSESGESLRNELEVQTALTQINERLTSANEGLRATVADSEKKLKSFQSKLNKDIQEFKHETVDNLKAVRDEIDDSKNRVVETLALFAALFTFLSVDIQILRNESNPDQLVGLVLITGGLITFFVLILDLLVKTTSEDSWFWRIRVSLLFAMSAMLVISGIVLFKLK